MPFSVMTSGIGGNVTIRATNNRRFDAAFPTSLFLETGNRVNSTVTLSAPLNTPSGTDFTLTIEAEAPGDKDTNYVVLLSSVVNTVIEKKSNFKEVTLFQVHNFGKNLNNFKNDAIWY